jgi:hypothetical protein
MTTDSNKNPYQDLATKNPDMLNEMISLWFDQAEKYNRSTARR